MGACQPLSDAGLMGAAAQGDERAFAQLVRRHAPRARAVAVRHLGGVADADDVVQEAFAAAWSARGRFDPARGAFTGWLYRIVATRCLDHLRRRRVWGWLTGGGGDAVEDVVPHPSAGPARRTAARDAMARARAALADLPARQRMALLLATVAELPSAEIGAALGVSANGAEALLSRARRAMRDRAAAEGWRMEDDHDPR